MNPTRRHFLHLLSAASATPLLSFGAEGSRLNTAAAAKYVATHGGHALYIKQHEQVIHESYANGASKGEARRIYSGTKGFWGLTAMAAQEDGILNVDEKVSATLPEWNTADKKTITIEQLLDFNCGLERCLRLHQDGLKNRNKMAIERPLVGTPGRSFIYGPSALQVFHEVLKRKLSRKKHEESPTRYLERRVLRPMGLGPQRYLADGSGNPLLAAGFLLSPAQWARMGDLLVANGSPVLKPGSMSKLLEGSSSNGAYSFGFWNNRAAGKLGGREIDIENMLDVDWTRQSWGRVCIAKGVPKDLVACIGSSYQRLYAIPSMGLVVVRQGLNARYSDGTFLRTLLG